MIASIVWDVDPILFKVGSWGLFKKEKYPEEWVDKLFVYCIVSTVIGARLGHCLFYEWDYYGAHPVEIFKIWKGGLASHGGVFAIILALMWYSKKVTRKSVWWLFDRMIPAVAIVCFCIRFIPRYSDIPPRCLGDLNLSVPGSGISCMKVCLAILLRFMKCCIAWLPV